MSTGAHTMLCCSIFETLSCPLTAKVNRAFLVAVRYRILDNPPWYEAIFLGFQHYLTMLGSTVSARLLLGCRIWG